MPQTTLDARPYVPATPLTGGEQSVVYRGRNMILRGLAPNLYFEQYSGSENLSQPIPSVAITGTVSCSPVSATVTGSGTSFLGELHIGQQLQCASGEVLTVQRLVDDTHFINGRIPTAIVAGEAAYRTPVLFPLDINRGSQLTGNALHFDKGTILSVGSGVLYQNGAVLPGDSLTATRTPQVALYNAASLNYDVQTVGFSAVPTISNAYITIVTGGGRKNMSLGYYSFKIAYYSTITDGYGNPTDTLLSGGTAGYNVTVANSQFHFDFSQDSSPPAKADGYIIYGSAFAGSSAISQVNSIQGGWFEVARIPFTSLGNAATVAGAGTGSANGDYVANGTSHGRTNYNRTGYTPTLDAITWSGTAWGIYDVGGNLLYESSNDVLYPWLATFIVAGIGAGPAPTVTQTSAAAHTINLDYIDTDLGSLVSFDNDFPPDAEYYGSIDRYPILVSTNGAGVGSSTRSTTTSPGPYISPIKAGNFDAYPSTFKVPTEKGEIIIGAVSAAGRMFVLTSNTLQAVTPTQVPAFPFTCRPFWKRGFAGPYNLAFVDDTLYGFTTAGMFRSIATGDEGDESHIFASDVESQTADWHGSYVYVVHDPKNEQICFVYSASRQNAQGYWESDILPYSLRQSCWQPTVVLSDPTRDMVVSGVATIAGHFEFIAGGRRSGTTVQFDTWRYDTGSGVDVAWYLAWNFQDNGVEMTAKTIRKMRPKGKFTSATMQLYLTTPDTNVDVTDLEAGTNATFEAVLANSTTVKQYGVTKCRARNGMMYTARIEGTGNWNGDPDTEKDQFHELALEVDVSGQLR